MSDRQAFSPTEFAALFGKERTWAYRLLSQGKIKKMDSQFGQILIPASEVKRLTDGLQIKEVPKKVAPAPSAGEMDSKPSAQKWDDELAARRSGSAKAVRPGHQSRDVEAAIKRVFRRK